jgi:Cytotoxic
MPVQNKYLIENKKPVELVQELEKYEIKKSPLSPAARGKVINKSGSDYISESKEDYGPGNGQSNLSDGEKAALIGVSVGVAVGATILTAGVATPIAVKGVEAVVNSIDYISSGGGNGGESSSSSNMNIGSGSVSSSAKGASKTGSPVWQGLKNFRGEIRTNGLSGSERSYFTWDYTHCNIEKFNHLGKHMGSIDPVSGNVCKSAVPGRSIKL